MRPPLSRSYRELVLFGPFTPLPAEGLAGVEATLGVALPQPYRRLLEVANGGTVEYDVRLPSGDVVSFPDLIPADRLGAEYRSLQESFLAVHLPVSTLLPVARDGCGSLLMLDLGAERHGRVVAFVHGLPAWTGSSRDDMFVELAPDVDAYLDSLFIDDETAESEWSGVLGTALYNPWRDVVVQWLDRGLPDWRDRPWARSSGATTKQPARDNLAVDL